MRRHADDLTEIRGALWNNLNTKGAKHRIVWITQNAIKRTFLCYLTQKRRKWLKPRPILSPIGWRTATSQHILVNGSFIIFSIDEYAFFFCLFFFKRQYFWCPREHEPPRRITLPHRAFGIFPPRNFTRFLLRVLRWTGSLTHATVFNALASHINVDLWYTGESVFTHLELAKLNLCAPGMLAGIRLSLSACSRNLSDYKN